MTRSSTRYVPVSLRAAFNAPVSTRWIYFTRLALTLALLAAPHAARATSIPLVITFNEYAERTVDSIPDYHPVTPIVFHAVLTLNDALSGTAVVQTVTSASVNAATFAGISLPDVPAPDNVGPLTGDFLNSGATEVRMSGEDGGPSAGLHYVQVVWSHDQVHGIPGWLSWRQFVLTSEKRREYPGADVGSPTMQSVLDTLLWGGEARADIGWIYALPSVEGGEGPIGPMNVRDYRGTYALDTTATVPEPASLALFATGLLPLLRREPTLARRPLRCGRCPNRW